MEFDHINADCLCSGKQCKDCGKVKCINDFPMCVPRQEYRSAYCRPCLNQRKYVWAEANKDKAKESQRKYNKTSEYIRQVRREYALNWNRAHPEVVEQRRRKWKMEKKYKLSVDEYAAMLEHQEGVCAICGKPETVKSRKGEVLALAIDHDHATGKVRGLLCFRCNTTLGTYERNVTSFQAYLFASASPEQEISQLENQLLVIENNIPLADSREIALDLGTSHKSFRELLQDKQSHIEKHFGVLRFLTAKPSSGSTGGRPEKYALLTEEQAYYALTFCDNTDKAMELRAKLIKAFMEAKEQIAALQKQLAQPQELPLAGGDSFLSDVRTLLNVPTLKELQAVERYIRAAKAFYSHKDGEITAQPTTKQLFAPKADKNTIEYVQAQILKHLNNHGPLTFNTLYHSYMKNRDEMTARKALDALVEQGIVQRETTSHSIKYSVDAYSQQA